MSNIHGSTMGNTTEGLDEDDERPQSLSNRDVSFVARVVFTAVIVIIVSTAVIFYLRKKHQNFDKYISSHGDWIYVIVHTVIIVIQHNDYVIKSHS